MKSKNLLGQKFSRLTVIERMPNNKFRQAMWKCKCDCGSNKDQIVTSTALITGRIKSCGCLVKEINSKRLKKYNTYDITGEYGIGYTSKGEEFYFDLEDYDLIKDYCWRKTKGYIITTKNKKLIIMHRLILGLTDNTIDVDHIFHDKHDNRKSKLRKVTKSQNQMNTDINNVNISGVKGVSWNKRDEVWEVYMQCTYMGRFYDFNKAVEYRKKLEEENYGEYSYDNSMKLNNNKI